LEASKKQQSHDRVVIEHYLWILVPIWWFWVVSHFLQVASFLRHKKMLWATVLVMSKRHDVIVDAESKMFRVLENYTLKVAILT
jgi:hypothetical protein